jgi:hypothetical protein
VIVQCHGCVVIERTEEAPDMQTGRGKHVAMMKTPMED